MHSVLFSLDHIVIHSFGACLAVAIILCYFVMARLGKPLGYTSDFISTLLTVLIVSGLIGARLFYVAEHLSFYAVQPASIFKIWEGGLMFFGGLLVACASLVIFIRLQKKPLASVLDIIVTAVPLSHAIGRIGCFLNGCCYGRTSDSCVAVTFPHGSIPWSEQLREGLISADAAHALPVLPSQLFEAGLNFIIFIVMLLLFKRRRHPGSQVAAYMMMYSVARFILELSRADERLHFGWFSISQAISLGLFTVGAALALGIAYPLSRPLGHTKFGSGYDLRNR